MGILDDAIREHMELRRRTGAAPAEIEQIEQVLGTDVPLQAEAPVEQRDVAVAPLVLEPAAAEPDPVSAEEAVEQPTRQFTAAEVAEAGPADAPPRAAPQRDPEPPVEEQASGEHDELEQTPDFLQETPEHDRLWFEQKPPKDFDF